MSGFSCTQSIVQIALDRVGMPQGTVTVATQELLQ